LSSGQFHSGYEFTEWAIVTYAQVASGVGPLQRGFATLLLLVGVALAAAATQAAVCCWFVPIITAQSLPAPLPGASVNIGAGDPRIDTSRYGRGSEAGEKNLDGARHRPRGFCSPRERAPPPHRLAMALSGPPQRNDSKHDRAIPSRR
jgi:hypothetical protein